MRPTRKVDGPRHPLPIWSCFQRGLPSRPVTRNAGELLPHLFTLTSASRGGLVSVALSVGSPRPRLPGALCPVKSGLSSPDASTEGRRPANSTLIVTHGRQVSSAKTGLSASGGQKPSPRAENRFRLFYGGHLRPLQGPQQRLAGIVIGFECGWVHPAWKNAQWAPAVSRTIANLDSPIVRGPLTIVPPRLCHSLRLCSRFSTAK